MTLRWFNINCELHREFPLAPVHAGHCMDRMLFFVFLSSFHSSLILRRALLIGGCDAWGYCGGHSITPAIGRFCDASAAAKRTRTLGLTWSPTDRVHLIRRDFLLAPVRSADIFPRVAKCQLGVRSINYIVDPWMKVLPQNDLSFGEFLRYQIIESPTGTFQFLPKKQTNKKDGKNSMRFLFKNDEQTWKFEFNSGIKIQRLVNLVYAYSNQILISNVNKRKRLM